MTGIGELELSEVTTVFECVQGSVSVCSSGTFEGASGMLAGQEVS